MAAVLEATADRMYAEADGLAKKASGFLSGLFGNSDKMEEAAEKFTRAGNGYKGAKNWARAAVSYERAADCYQRLKGDNNSDIASSYTEAARAYIKAGDAGKGNTLLEEHVIPRVVDSGKLAQAAKLLNELADQLNEDGEAAAALPHYERAADFFEADRAASSAIKCRQQMADINCKLEPPQLDKAAEMYERVAREQLSSKLLAPSAKANLMNAVFCLLALGDTVTANDKFTLFKDLDYTFENAREGKLCADLVQAATDNNGKALGTALWNYDQISRFTPLQTQLLVRVKAHVESGGLGGADVGGSGGGSSAAGGGDDGML